MCNSCVCVAKASPWLFGAASGNCGWCCGNMYDFIQSCAGVYALVQLLETVLLHTALHSLMQAWSALYYSCDVVWHFTVSPSFMVLWSFIQLTLGPGYFEFFKCKEFPQYMWELKISKLNISEKKLNIDGHLVSTLGGSGGLERTDF